MNDLDDEFDEFPIPGLLAGKFRLGQVLIEAGTAEELDRALVERYLRRHASGDWGEVDPDTRSANARALQGARDWPIVSIYRVGGRPLQIATKADGSVTSIVLYEARPA